MTFDNEAAARKFMAANGFSADLFTVREMGFQGRFWIIPKSQSK